MHAGAGPAGSHRRGAAGSRIPGDGYDPGMPKGAPAVVIDYDDRGGCNHCDRHTPLRSRRQRRFASKASLYAAATGAKPGPGDDGGESEAAEHR